MFGSEIGSGFGEPGGTPLSRIIKSTSPGLLAFVPRIEGGDEIVRNRSII